MPTPESEGGALTHSPELRDRLLRFIPEVALTAKRGAEGTFWPVGSATELIVRYVPDTKIIGVGALETVRSIPRPEPDMLHVFRVYKGVEIHKVTAAIGVYEEAVEVRNSKGQLVEPVTGLVDPSLPPEFIAAELELFAPFEQDVSPTFTVVEQNYFLAILNKV